MGLSAVEMVVQPGPEIIPPFASVKSRASLFDSITLATFDVPAILPAVYTTMASRHNNHVEPPVLQVKDITNTATSIASPEERGVHPWQRLPSSESGPDDAKVPKSQVEKGKGRARVLKIKASSSAAPEAEQSFRTTAGQSLSPAGPSARHVSTPDVSIF
ncbi:hypothetical protein CkaCkLH20_12254 [Colletotrichum karsti]|uniref:Uncharacterized protein n=1 Tax=Colletotrichum karsti TaxID=1095194 RepID=A0A9P6HUJ3_9PEZI|nr:uncharacterized protein CkaCkLH20_12254 [Colletotrichum karsti]KAF9870290.1 hypothetical protein CkaCkLH20_12254 [Colletotrichum karsti]